MAGTLKIVLICKNVKQSYQWAFTSSLESPLKQREGQKQDRK